MTRFRPSSNYVPIAFLSGQKGVKRPCLISISGFSPIAICIFFLQFHFICVSQNSNNSTSNKTKWTVRDPFEQKVFIENKGQFDEKPGDGSTKVIFGTSFAGVDLFFSSKGLTYKYNELVSMTESEKEIYEKGSNGQEEEEIIKDPFKKYTPGYLFLEWIGSDSNVQVIAEEPVPFYYTYGGDKKDINTTLKAGAYKKIIYKNLYPNIDLEYIFPVDTGGIKYTLIIHPGGDLTAIRMRYKNAKKLFKDSQGNMLIKSEFGEFKDHAPSATYEGGEQTNMEFDVNGNTVSFKSNSATGGNQERTLIIDPWTISPVFTGYDKAYDVNYDLKGNVYVHGSALPLKVAKMSSTGIIQWVFNAVNLGVNSWYQIYGDFALDEITGTSYLVEGFAGNGRTGAAVYKVNTLGIQTGTFPGNNKITEMWRAEYNRCINKIVLVGGGADFICTYQAAMLDTNVTTITPINVLATNESAHDMTLLAIDNNDNFCYMATAQRSQISRFDNTMIKCPIPTLLPLVFSVPDGHKFQEATSVFYQYNNIGNGTNGMAVSPNWLYTYDGDSLKRWDKNTGALIAGIHVSSSPANYGKTQKQILVNWGGLSVDQCDNIYVGVGSSIKQYDAALILINTIPLSDTVFDVKLGLNATLYACGKGFITELNIQTGNINFGITSTNASSFCACDGSATITSVTCGNPSGYSYSWSTSPVQNTQTALGLCPGIYTATVTTNCFNSYTNTVTVGIDSATITLTDIILTCNGGNDGTARAIPGGGTGPYIYNWTNGQTTQTASGLVAGTYSVIITNLNGCRQTQAFNITEPAPLLIEISGKDTICDGQSTTISATGGVLYSWDNGSSTATLTFAPRQTTSYTLMVSDSLACSASATITITVNPVPTASITGEGTICSGDNAIFVAGEGEAYLWKAGETTQNIGISPTTDTSISVIVFEGLCSDTASTDVFVNNYPTAMVSGVEIICAGGNTTLTAGGAGIYTWNTGETEQNIRVSPKINTEYFVVVTNASCSDTAWLKVMVKNIQGKYDIISIMEGASRRLSATEGDSYTWFPDDGLSCSNCQNPIANPEKTTSYYVRTQDSSGCMYMDSILIIVVHDTRIYIPTGFTPNGDGLNDIFLVSIDFPEQYAMTIFNRWGEKLFESYDINMGWDGTLKGERVEGGVYVYSLEVIIGSSSINKTGSISLLR